MAAAGTRRVQLARRDGRDVSTLYGREGGGVRETCLLLVESALPLLALAALEHVRGRAQVLGRDEHLRSTG